MGYKVEPDSQEALGPGKLLGNSQAPSLGALGKMSDEQFQPLSGKTQIGLEVGGASLSSCLPGSFSASLWTLPGLG